MSYIRYLLFVFASVLILIEVVLRIIGYKSGILMSPQQINKIPLNFPDSIYLTTLFKADSNGIMMIDREYNTANFDHDFDHFNTTLKRMVKRNVFHVPINSNGFQDSEFSLKDTTCKKKIMLLGDSFTWGYSPDSIQHSFANLLGNEDGIVTYNLGVPGSDVATYLKLAQLYVPIIKPDYLIVNFYFSNDFLYYRKKLIPFVYPDLYPTNAGGFYKMNYETVDDDSIELFDTYTDAFNYTAEKYTWRGEQNSQLRFAMQYSVLVTQLVRKTKGYYNPRVNSTFVPHVDCTAEYIWQIDSICRASHTEFILAVINNGKDDNELIIKKCRASFGNHPFYITDGMNKQRDYVPSPDGHFNTLGHKKYEHFLLRILRGEEKEK